MIRRLTLALALVTAFGLAAAQIDISPTTDQGADVAAEGTTEASVDQLVTLSIPQATALHLTQNAITFDIGGVVDGDGLAGESCVYVTGDDVSLMNGAWSVPGGIAYEADTWDTIRLVYFGNGKTNFDEVTTDQLVVAYPPIDVTAGDINATKAYFVCYRTFIMQLFSNFDSWDLTVERTDTAADGSIDHLYIQANTCADFGTPTGLFALNQPGMDATTGEPVIDAVSLLPASITGAPTGELAAGSDDCRANSSWMDVLGVMAVKVNSDRWGDNTANLTYTLMSPDPR